jgi:hypothetical protein
MVIWFDVAGFPKTHDPLEVSLQRIASLLVGVYVYVALVAALMSVPFFRH